MSGSAIPILYFLWMIFIGINGYMPCPGEKFCSCLGSNIHCERALVKDIPWKKIPTWVELISLRQIYDLKHLSADMLPVLPKLKKLNVTSCRNLVSLGGDLPAKLPNLHLLRITQTGLRTSPAFDSPGPALRVLILNNNNLTALDPRTSRSMPMLTRLEVNHNRLDRLDSKWFRKGNQITFLSANANAISRLSSDLGSALPRLRVLRLNKNRLRALRGPRKGARPSGSAVEVLPGMPSVVRLELARNRMTTIDSLAFRDWRALKVLILRKNNLRTPETGAFYIEGGGLRELDLMGNPSIDRFGSQWAYGFDGLQRLVAARCGIRRVQVQALALMGPALRHLDLSANKLSQLTPGMWSSLRRLRVLKLAGNSLSRLPEKAFVGLTELRELSLGANSLSRLTPVGRNGASLPSVLSPLGNLTVLDLSFNRLSHLTASDLAGPAPGLQRLLLNGNNLTHLDAAAFTQLSHLSQLQIDSTRLVCNCEAIAISSWLSHSPRLAKGVRGANCSSPAALARRSLLSLDSSDLSRTCDPSGPAGSPPGASVASERVKADPGTAENANIELLRGKTLRLRCRTTVQPSTEFASPPELAEGPPVTFRWFRMLNQLQIPVQVSEPRVRVVSSRISGPGNRWLSELRIQPVRLQDAGAYRCLIERHNPRAEPEPAPLFNVSVYVAPKFTDKPPPVISTLVGANVHIPCAASGNPPPHSSLRKRGGLYFPAAKEHRLSFYTGDPNFVLSNVKRFDAGDYSCESVNAGGNISQPFRLVVNEIPRLKARPKGHQVFDVGQPGVLACKAIGWPFPRIIWTKNEKKLDLPTSLSSDPKLVAGTSRPSGNDRVRLSSRDQLLLFSHVTIEDAGVYTCVVRNVVGRSEARIVLDVRTPTGVYPGDRERVLLARSNANWMLSNMTGIVVIAVVSCVVVTSIIWVGALFCLKRRLRRKACARAASLVMASECGAPSSAFLEQRRSSPLPSNLSPLLSSSIYITSLSDSLPGLGEQMAMLADRRTRGGPVLVTTTSTFHAPADSAPASPTSLAPSKALTEAPSSGYNSGNSDYSVGGPSGSEESSSGSLRSSAFVRAPRLNIPRRSDSEEEPNGSEPPPKAADPEV